MNANENNNWCYYSDLPSVMSYDQSDKHSTSAKKNFTPKDIDRIIQMAWEDRTPFEAIEFQFELKEKEVIEFMRRHSLPSSFRMWRKRMKGRKTKHGLLRTGGINRFKCSRQRLTGNKIAKR
jgi:uncharacterized protein (TIGR03643 family)